MKLICSVLLLILGFIFGAGELIYTTYIAGEVMETAVIFDEGRAKPHQIEISEADLPVRLNMRMWGARRRNAITAHSYVTLQTGGSEPGDTIGFHAGISEEGDKAYWGIARGNASLGSRTVPNLTQGSQLFEQATTGTWNLSAAVSDEDHFNMVHIEATIRRNSRATNWSVAGPGLAAFLLGFLLFVSALKKNDQLAED